MVGWWQPLLVASIALSVGFAFARWLVHLERKSQTRARLEKAEVAKKLHGKLQVGVIDAKPLLSGFKLFKQGGSGYFQDLIEIPFRFDKGLGSEELSSEKVAKCFIGDYRFSKMSGEGSLDTYRQTVFLIYADTLNFEKVHTRKLGMLDLFDFGVTPIEQLLSFASQNIVESRGWSLEAMENRFVVYKIDKSHAPTDYEKVLIDVRQVWEDYKKGVRSL